MLRRVLVIGCCVGASLVVPAASVASVITITAGQRGWYESDGDANGSSATASYLVGDCSNNCNPRPGTDNFHNWFKFLLPALSGETIVSATLLLDNPATGFRSSNGGETYTLFDVAAGNVAGLGTKSTTIWNDLGGGAAYGSFSATSAANGSTLSIVLNAAALNALNGAVGSSFAVGGAITTLDGVWNDEGLFFGTGASSVTKLQLVTAAVPEPSSLLVLGCGLAGVALKVRRRRKAIR